MILSTTSTDRPARPELAPAPAQAGRRAPDSPSDKISTENAEFLRSELKRQPEVRADVVARARALAADPDYPPMEVLRKIAGTILASPDLSEDES